MVFAPVAVSSVLVFFAPFSSLLSLALTIVKGFLGLLEVNLGTRSVTDYAIVA